MLSVDTSDMVFILGNNFHLSKAQVFLLEADPLLYPERFISAMGLHKGITLLQ